MSKMTCDVCGAEGVSVNYGDSYTVICRSCSGTEKASRVIEQKLPEQLKESSSPAAAIESAIEGSPTQETIPAQNEKDVHTRDGGQGDLAGVHPWIAGRKEWNEFVATMRGDASQSSGDTGQSRGPVRKPSGDVRQSSRYRLARSIAKIVIVVGWISVGVGALVFLIGFGALVSGELRLYFFLGIAGLIGVWQGIMIILVAYGLMGIFDMADDSSKTVSRLDGIFRLLSDRDERSGKKSETAE